MPFSLSVVSDSLGPHELQHARLPCSSLFWGVCSNACPLSQWKKEKTSPTDGQAGLRPCGVVGLVSGQQSSTPPGVPRGKKAHFPWPQLAKPPWGLLFPGPPQLWDGPAGSLRCPLLCSLGPHLHAFLILLVTPTSLRLLPQVSSNEVLLGSHSKGRVMPLLG